MRWRPAPALAIVLGYFALAIVASAIDRASTIGWRELALLMESEQRELALAFRLSMGELGRERGPLHTALLYLGALGAPTDVSRLVLARHLIFPLASLGLVTAIARAAVGWARAGVLLGGGLLALHLADETLVPLLGLAACLLLVGGQDEPARRDLARGLRAGLVLVTSALLAPSFVLPALASALAVGLSAASVLGRRALVRAGGACAAVAAGGLALVLAGFREQLVPALAPVTPSALAPLLAEALALACILRLERPRSREAALSASAWVGAVPIAAAGLLSAGGDDAPYLALVAPSIALLVVAARSLPRAPLASGVAALVVALFVLGSAPRYDRRTAWRPTVFADLAEVARGRRGPQPEDNDLFAAATRMADLPGCVAVTADLSAAQLVAGVPGPIDGDAPRDLEGWSCPHALTSIRSFDRPYRLAALAFGPDLRERAERYAVAERIGPATFLARERAPVRATERRMDLDVRVVSDAVGALRVDFDREVPAEHVVVLRVRTAARRVVAHVLSAGRTIREPMEVSVHAGELWIPVEAERAEWRWIAGRSSRDRLHADAVRIEPEQGAWLAVDGALELSPPQAPPERARPCARALELWAAPGYARRTRAPVEAERVLLDPNPPGYPAAELFVPLTPCPGTCLVGEVGLDGEAGGGFGFEIHVVDGAERPRLLDWQVGAGWSRPFELPLDRWAGRDVLVRMATTPGARADGDHARVHRPRVRPCASVVSVVHALHDGRHRVVRGAPSVVGDALRLPLAPRGQPPTEVRLPLEVPEGACVAVDIGASDHDRALAAVLGVVAEGRVHRIVREVFAPHEQPSPRSHADLSLAAWAGREVELYFAAWPLERGGSGLASFVRPRVHRCGERADWAF